MLRLGDAPVGYGSLAVAGPWKEKPTLFEFYVLPQHRTRLFDLFWVLLTASGAVAIEAQSNAPLLTTMLHTFARDVVSESILFQDGLTTHHAPPGALVRRVRPADAEALRSLELDPDATWLVESGGAVAGAGGILFHYNRPYGDIYMQVAEPFRRRGLGAYLVQEMKRECYTQGSVPAARCNPTNVASRKTLQRAGFVPCGHRLTGSVAHLTAAVEVGASGK
jgi:GNAT superfamily N-acetyltransferase